MPHFARREWQPHEGKKLMSKFLALRLNRFVPSGLLALLAAVLLAPAAANATSVKYDFTITATHGPLNGTVSHGTFSCDSSSITPGTENDATNLLTALDFTWNGTTYNAATANTGMLAFDAAGQLDAFVFGNSCYSFNCFVQTGLDQWFVQSAGSYGFFYSMPDYTYFGAGTITYSLATTSVPEPAALGMFGFGMLLIGLFAGLRRRMV